jgi:Sec-independent protein secretion pathway component TatC
MSDNPRASWLLRSTAYFLLGIAAAIATPSPDVVTMLLVWIAGVALFEVGFLVYRRSKDSEQQ